MSSEHGNEFSDDGFWKKVGGYASDAGKTVLEPAFKMYYSLVDDDTPIWAKTTITGALGYFVFPLDAIPDFVPGVGYSDDLGILVAAVSAVAAHIKPQHARMAREKLREIFD